MEGFVRYCHAWVYQKEVWKRMGVLGGREYGIEGGKGNGLVFHLALRSLIRIFC
jgi:hypothetical protein